MTGPTETHTDGKPTRDASRHDFENLVGTPIDAPAPGRLDAPPGEGLAALQEGIDLAVPFGQVLVQQGIVTPDEVERTVELQAQLARRGVFLRLGELLVARDLVDSETVAKVLALQGTQILVCPTCLTQFNVVAYAAGKRYRCSRCHEVLNTPAQIAELAVEDTLIASEWREAFSDVSGAEGRPFGNYEILGQISRGGMGIVYKARQRGLDRIVAMKVITESEVTSAQSVELFRREARAMAALRHPYIVPVHEIGRIGEVEFYTMEYIEGLPLHRAVASESLEPREIVEIIVKVCEAVDYAHSQGTLHRDLKPQNILLDRKHNPVLIDFGLSAEDEGAETIVGSPAYLPPEYISGEAEYGPQGEVYALGATLYGALAGRAPHTGIDTVQVLRRANVEAITPIRTIRRNLDRDLATTVMTALSRDPQDRYATVRDLANDLRRWLQGEEIAGRSAPWQRSWSRVRGRVAAAVGLTLAGLLVVSSLTLAVERQGHLDDLRSRSLQSDFERTALREQLLSARLDLANAHLAAGDLEACARLLERIERTEHGLEGLRRVGELRAALTAAIAARELPSLEENPLHDEAEPRGGPRPEQPFPR